MTTYADAIDWIARLGTVLALLTWLVRSWLRTINRRAVRSFFGGESVTVYLPMRELGGRRAVAEPDFVAANLLRSFLDKHRVKVTFDFVSPEGAIDLSAEGLVVICGPKTSTVVGNAMATDGRLSFEETSNHWQVRDLVNGNLYRSPMDTVGSSADIGYLGRSSRRAGAPTTFLSIAGIHAEGSVAVVSYLCSPRRLRQLSRQVRGGRLFSAVVAGEYSTSPLRVIHSEMVTLRVGSVPVRGSIEGIIHEPQPAELRATRETRVGSFPKSTDRVASEFNVSDGTMPEPVTDLLLATEVKPTELF